jgi:hypothetical protein
MSIGTATIWRFTSGDGPASGACGATYCQLALMIGSKIGMATPDPVPVPPSVRRLPRLS